MPLFRGTMLVDGVANVGYNQSRLYYFYKRYFIVFSIPRKNIVTIYLTDGLFMLTWDQICASLCKSHHRDVTLFRSTVMF